VHPNWDPPGQKNFPPKLLKDVGGTPQNGKILVRKVQKKSELSKEGCVKARGSNLKAQSFGWNKLENPLRGTKNPGCWAVNHPGNLMNG